MTYSMRERSELLVSRILENVLNSLWENGLLYSKLWFFTSRVLNYLQRLWFEHTWLSILPFVVRKCVTPLGDRSCPRQGDSLPDIYNRNHRKLTFLYDHIGHGVWPKVTTETLKTHFGICGEWRISEKGVNILSYLDLIIVGGEWVS